MGTINRGTKAAGGTSFVDDTDILASEVNTDFDRVYTLVNGNIDSTNISASAAIPNASLVDIDGTKVSDHADNAATYETRTSAGDTASPSLPTNLEEEHERLRYRLERAGRYASAQYTDSGDTNQTVSWTEPPIQGGNLLVNSGFEGADPAANAPHGWTEEGTLTDSELGGAAAATGLYARHLTLKGDTSSGISQTVSGLKASTKYLFGCVYTRVLGTVLIETTGGLAAGSAYQDSSVSDNSTTSLQTVNMIVQTTGVPADIDFRILCGANGTDFDVVEAWCYELNDSRPADTPTGLMQTATHSTEEDLPATFTDNSGTWQYEVIDELDLAQYIPSPGYRLIYEANINYETSSIVISSAFQYAFRLMLNTGGGDSVVDGPYVVRHGGANGVQNHDTAGVITLRYVLDNPTPGLTYDFSASVGAYGGSGGVTGTYHRATISPDRNSLQSVSKAWLRLERI